MLKAQQASDAVDYFDSNSEDKDCCNEFESPLKKCLKAFKKRHHFRRNNRLKEIISK